MAQNKGNSQEEKIMDRKGTIVLLSQSGVGLVQLEDSKKVFIFTFDKIPGYRGESVRELGARGVREGQTVVFDADKQNISALRLPSDGTPQREFRVASVTI
jgi:hypothetical protein